MDNDTYRIKNWIRYWAHEQNKAILLIDDIRLEINKGGNKEVLEGGIRYFEYKVYEYQVSIDKLRKELID